jgi:hypothetical protein
MNLTLFFFMLLFFKLCEIIIGNCAVGFFFIEIAAKNAGRNNQVEVQRTEKKTTLNETKS